MKAYYEDESVMLYNADCMDVLPSLGGVDLVVTSPPYNLGAAPWAHLGHYKMGQIRGGERKWSGVSRGGVDYDLHDDALPWPEYEQSQRAVLTALWATLSETGAIFYNHKPRLVGEQVWLPTALNPGLPLRQIVIWARAGGMNYLKTGYVSTHEWLMVFAKPGWRLRDKSASGVGDVWRINQDTGNPHPASFPLDLPARVIETTAPVLVLDPYAGSGTTLLAAAQAGVRAIGIESSERYCEMAATRLAQGVLTFGDAS